MLLHADHRGDDNAARNLLAGSECHENERKRLQRELEQVNTLPFARREPVRRVLQSQLEALEASDAILTEAMKRCRRRCNSFSNQNWM